MTSDSFHSSHQVNHHTSARTFTKNRLWIALGITAFFLIIEVIGGIVANSLALLADAGHMLTDVGALILAITVAHLAERAPSAKKTYGLLRAEVLGAFINGATLVVIVGVIFWEAWKRFGTPLEIDGSLMLIVAVFGLAANSGSAWALYGSRHENVNVSGAFLHVVGDALGSVGVIVAGIIIWTTGWTPIDPLISIFIGLVILRSSWGLIRETVNILLDATPEEISYEEVMEALLSVKHIKEVHDLHIWTISSGIPSLSAHIQLCQECGDTTHWQECLRNTQDMLRERFGITHTTLQFEPHNYKRDDRPI
jgi:cobalt-zinc-cadmium efflux system protein